MTLINLPNDSIKGYLRDGEDYAKGSYVYSNDKAIIDVVNGQLTDNNISPSAAIQATKIADTAATLTASQTLSNKTLVSPIIDVVKLITAPTSDKTASGILLTLTANENHTFGDACYINSSGKAAIGDADAISTSMVCVMCVSPSVSSGDSGSYMVLGVARNDSWNWTVGGAIYLSTAGTTGNTLTQTAPSGSNDVVQILGVATHADRILFNPSLMCMELI